MGNKRQLFEHHKQAVIFWKKVLVHRFSHSFNKHSGGASQRSPWLTVLSFLSSWWGRAGGESDQQVKYVLGAKTDKEYARKSDFPAVCSHFQHPKWIVICV